MMAAPPSSYGENPPLQGYRRSFTAPPRSLSHHEKAGLDPSDSVADRLYSHPKVRIIKFTIPAESVPTSKSIIPPDTDYPVDTIETLPWRSSMETTLALAPMVIEKVRGSTNFLKCGVVHHAILRNSQCWCVDGESRFVLRIRKFEYYRIEMPNGTELEKQKIEDLQVVLKKILRFEVTPCPFKRGFHVELSDSDLTPRRKGQWKRRESSLISSPLSEIPQLRRTGRKWSMPMPERNSAYLHADADASADSGYGEDSARGGRKFEDEYDDSDSHEDSSPERRPSPLANRADMQGHQGGEVGMEHLEDDSEDEEGSAAVRRLSGNRVLPTAQAAVQTSGNESDAEVEEAELGEALPKPSAASANDDATEKMNESTVESEKIEEPSSDLRREETGPPQSHTDVNDEESDVENEESSVLLHKVEADEIEKPTPAVPHEDAGAVQSHPASADEIEEPMPGVPHEDAGAVQLHPASADESSHSVGEEPSVLLLTDEAAGIEGPARNLPRDESESTQAHAATDDVSSHIETLASSDKLSEHVGGHPSTLDEVPETAKDLSQTANYLHEEATKQRELIENKSSLSPDAEDSQSLISSADSFHTLSPDDEFPIHEEAPSDYDPDRFRSSTPRGNIDSSLGFKYPKHRRDTSEVTVREGSTAEAPTETSDIPSTPILVRSSASDSSWPDIGTPASPDIQQGLRNRLRSRRSLSPLPPSSTIYNPSQSHAQGNHFTLALLQKCSVALVKPIEMVAMLFHILARIAGGATVNDLISGDLFKKPDERPQDHRRHQGLPDQIDHRQDGDTDEDDYGVPIRGRSKNSGPVNRDVDTDWLMDLD